MPRLNDRSTLLRTLTRQMLRRQRRGVAEEQPARCPLCDRVMVVLMGRRGPCFRCGCGDRNASTKRR